MKDLLDKVKAWAASVPGAVKSNKVTFIVAGVVVVLAFVVGCGIGGSGKSAEVAAAPQLSPEEQAKADAKAAEEAEAAEAAAEEAAIKEALKTVTLEAGIYSIVDGSKKPEPSNEYQPTDSKMFKYRVLEDGSGLWAEYIGDGAVVYFPKAYEGLTVYEVSIGNTKNRSNRKDPLQIKMPNTVKVIHYMNEYVKAIDSIEIPSSVVSIDDEAFAGLEIKDIALPTTTKLGNALFANCKFTKINWVFPIIPSSTFSGNKKLVTVTCTDNLKMIEAYAFANCVALTTINFTDSLKKIGTYAFDNCVELTAINGLPSTVVFEGKEEDDRQFRNVKKLSLATEAQIKAIHAGNKNKHYDEKFPWH